MKAVVRAWNEDVNVEKPFSSSRRSVTVAPSIVER
jgi:hypothetical protein